MEEGTMTFSEYMNGQSQDNSSPEQEEAQNLTFEEYQQLEAEKAQTAEDEALAFNANVQTKRQELKDAAEQYDLPEWWVRALTTVTSGFGAIGESIDDGVTGFLIDTFDEFTGGDRTVEEKKQLADKVFSLGGILPNTDAERKENLGDFNVNMAAAKTDFGTVTDEETGEVRQKDFVDLAGEGEFGDAAVNLGESLLDAIPSIAIAMTGIGGVAALGVSAAGSKAEEIDKEYDGEVDFSKKWGDAATTGAGEFLTEMVTHGIGKGLGRLVSKFGPEAAPKVLKQVGDVFASFALEGGSEIGADAISRAADKYYLGDKKAFDGFGRASLVNGIVGGIAGGGLSFLTNGQPTGTIAQKILTPKPILGAQRKAAVDIQVLKNEVENATSEPAKDIINQQIKQKQDSLRESNLMVQNQLYNLSDEQLKKMADISSQINLYQEMLNDEVYDDASKGLFSAKLLELEEEQNSIFSNPDITDIQKSEPISQKNVKLSKEAQDLYENNSNPTVIADKLGGIAGNVANRKWNMVAPDFQVGTYQDFLSALKFGKGGIVDMVRTYNPEKNDSIAAYVASLMDKRADRIIGKFTKRKAETSVDTARGVMAEESGPTAAELADRLTIPQKALEKAATNAELFNLKLDKISNIKDYVKQQKDFFKTYLTPEIKSFLKPKGSQLEKQKALKNYVYKNVDTLKDLYMAAPGLNKVRSGPIATWSITPPTNKEFADYVLGEDLDLSTSKGRNALNSRKDKIAERIADSIGQKAWQEFVSNNQQAQESISNLSKQLIEETSENIYTPADIITKIGDPAVFTKRVKALAKIAVTNKGYDNDTFNNAAFGPFDKNFIKKMWDNGDLVGTTYGGIIYEDASKAFLKAAGINVLEVQSGGFDSTVPDLQIQVKDGRLLNVEYKSNKGDRLGQFTIQIQPDGNIVYIENRKQIDINEYPGGDIINKFIQDKFKSDTFKQVIDKINEIEGRAGKDKITAIPFGTKIKQNTWDQILKLPAYRELVETIEIPIEAVIKHYTGKGPDKSSFLIQIGDSGLYHFKEPIKGIPSKKFEGTVVARFRLKSGGGMTKTGAASFSYTAELGVQGKFEKSDFNLDNKDDLAIFAAAVDNITPDDKLSFQLRKQEALEGLRDPKEKQINNALANHFESISNIPATEDASRTLAAMLESAWQGTVDSTTNKTTANQYLQDELGLTEKQAKSVTERTNGFQHGNFIFINKDTANMDTAFHEYQHIWNKIVYKRSPRVFNSIYEKIKNEAPELYAQQVKRIKESGYNFKEDSFEWKDEVIAGIGGLNVSKEFKNPAQQKSFKDLMLEYWEIVKKFLGITKMAKDKSLQDMTVGEVLDVLAAEVLSGKPGSILSKMKPESWLKTRIIKSAPAFSVSQNKQFQGLQALKNEYRDSKDLQKAIQAGYDAVKDSYSLEAWTEFVEQATKEVDIKNSKTLYVAKAMWLTSNDISLDNISELKDLEFTEELNRKARNYIYSAKDKAGPSKWFIPPNAEDFQGLLYTLFPKGEAGKEAKEFYTKYILDPYHKGVQNANAEVMNKIKAVESIITGVDINKDIEGTPYNIGTAVKAYNWVRNGQDPLPNSKSSQKQSIIDRMIASVESNPKLVELADFLDENTDIKYSDRMLTESLGHTILSEIQKGTRAKHLETFAKNVDAIFDQTNLDQLEKQFGKKYVQSLRGTIKRMKTGRNRAGLDAQSNVFAKWLGRSVGSTMFFNRRSALLQTISFINFIGKENNNLFQATQAYASSEANTVFKKLWTSDYLVNRRTGAKFDVLADEIAGEKNIIDKVLNAGFWPTKMADSMAIAFGGVPFYINTRNALIEQGMSKKEAEAEAMQRWIEAAEETQQSSDPSKISEIQASTVGKIIYAFANTPFQYARYAKRKMQDIANGTSKNVRSDMGSIFYYTVAQAALFSALQSGLLALAMFGDDDNEEKIDEKTLEAIERSIMSFMKSLGNPGAITAATYSVLKEAMSERTSGEKIALSATEISPPLNSKLKDLNSAYWAEKYEDYPGMIGKIGSFVGVPIDNVLAITNSLVAFSNDQLETWQKIMMALGWSEWDVAPEAVKKKPKKKEFEEETWNDNDWDDSDDWIEDDFEDTPVKKLKRGVAGVANRDGTIEVDPNLSPVEREKTIAHEEQHVKDIEAGKLDYDDNYVYWNNNKYERKDGNIIYNGKAYVEGHKDLPWEKKAYAAEPSTSEAKKAIKRLY